MEKKRKKGEGRIKGPRTSFCVQPSGTPPAATAVDEDEDDDDAT